MLYWIVGSSTISPTRTRPEECNTEWHLVVVLSVGQPASSSRRYSGVCRGAPTFNYFPPHAALCVIDFIGNLQVPWRVLLRLFYQMHNYVRNIIISSIQLLYYSSTKQQKRRFKYTQEVIWTGWRRSRRIRRREKEVNAFPCKEERIIYSPSSYVFILVGILLLLLLLLSCTYNLQSVSQLHTVYRICKTYYD